MQLIFKNALNNSRSYILAKKYSPIVYSSYFLSKNHSTSTESAIKPQPPKYIETRLNLWNELKRKYDAELESKPRSPIKVKILNRDDYEAVSWQTTPFEIASCLHKKLANDAIVAKVNGELWDLSRPLETDGIVELIKFDDPAGQQVFWHSAAHVLGEAMENIYGGLLCYGPPTENGFYYDMYNDQKGISSKDYQMIEKQMQQIVKERQPFERIEVLKSDLLELFQYNKFKLRIIDEQITNETATVYRCGTLIDLCRGPHVQDTGKIKICRVVKNSPVFWQGNKNAEKLERIYGISFPTGDYVKKWSEQQTEAAKRDHRKIGRDQELFFFHESSPGSCFFQPKGAHIYNTLINFIKAEYRKRGFEEVITPNIYNSKLWKQSGHWDHYADNMFSFKSDKETLVLKPMNCPGHCLIFSNRPRSYRELPLRLADFGVLHRNEYSGGLTGLTRVRRFQQDDAHIFCTPAQIQGEIDSCLDFLSYVYKTLGFTFDMVLSTRPNDYMGELEVWNKAEEALENSLNKFGHPWKLNVGDGAFYGPKIDITITDALKRAHQCATIQLDFQLPERFELTYDAGKESNNACRPVIIHRAIFGSVERLIAILTENYGGKWPFWLSPRQVNIVPVLPTFNEYAESIRKQLHDAGFMVDADLDESVHVSKKVRRAQLAQYNLILVVGQQEKDSNTVNVRTRNNKVNGQISIEELISKMNKLRDDFTLGDDSY